tara:strand:+ start:733 stop:951 length:219 start_codon:yes stop_codon:yes gene_type:complete
MSYFDSNVAKNNDGKLIKVSYFLSPIIPTNAKYVVITPTTPTALSPNFTVKDSDNNPYFASYDPNLSQDKDE